MASQFSHVRISFFVFTVLVWTTTGFGQAPKLLKESSEPASFVAVSPDGKTIAYTNNDNIIRLWDVKTGMVTRKIKVTSLLFSSPFPKNRISCITFSPDGKTLAACCYGVSLRPSEKVGELGQVGMESLIKVWDTNTGTLIHTPFRKFDKSDDFEDLVISLAFSPDGKILASSGSSKTVKLRDVKSGKVIRTLKGQNEGIFSVAFSPDGQTLAACTSEKSVLWDMKTGKQLWSHKNNGDGPCLFAFSPDGNIFSMADSDGLHIYDAKTRKETQLIKKNKEDYFMSCIVFSPDGKTMVTCDMDGINGDDTGKIMLWDVKNGKVSQSRKIRVLYYLKSVALFPDGKTLVSSTSLFGPEPMKFKLWDLTPIKLASQPK